MAHQPQLLMVWNPLVEPRTVKVHVDVLRKHATDRYAWWGRIYAGSTPMDPASLKKKWKHVFDLHKAARKEGRDLVVFVTDYHSLHALRVDYVKVGPKLPEENTARIPDHYLDEDHKVGIWFRVRDVRAVTHYQLRTLEYFREMMGPVKNSFALGERLPYDPYAAFKYDYPIVVDGPAARDLFDSEELARRQPGARGFADLRETVFPPDLQTILDELEESLPFLWPNVRDNTRIFLACARLVEQRYMGHERFDFSAAVCELAKAVETEVIDGLLARVLRVPEAAWPDEVLVDLRRARSQSRLRSLGSAGMILKQLGDGSPPSPLRQMAVFRGSGSPWVRWFEGFTHLRNGALHSELVDHDRFREVWTEMFARDLPSGLLPVVEAREAVESLLERDN